MPTTQIADVVVPIKFTPYVELMTLKSSALVQSGALALDAGLSAQLATGGAFFSTSFWKDLEADSDNVSSDNPAVTSTPAKTGTGSEVQVRLSRNNSWSAMDLSAELAGSDPMAHIANRVANYWRRRLQAAFVATITGVFADNAAAPTGSEHVLNDLTHNVSGSSFTDDVTNFTRAAHIDTLATMGEQASGSFGVMAVHPVVWATMKKKDQKLISTVPVAGQSTYIDRYDDLPVIVSNSLPRNGNLYETWYFGAGAVKLGVGRPKVPTEVFRNPASGNGGGEEILYSRTDWCIHPVGHAYKITPPPTGGPSNAATVNNLAHADSWGRVFPEREQIRIARLITREA